MAAFSSYLRVYEPLDAFPPAERTRWEVYLGEGRAPDPAYGVVVEHRAAVVAAIGLPPRVDVDQAFVHRRGGASYVGPWRTEVRSWQAVADFRRTMPEQVADAFIPRPAAEHAERELARWRSTQPRLKSHIRSSTWEVPLHWFVPFEGEERRLQLEPVASLTYLATMHDARRRVARALAVLRRTIEEGTLVESLAELADWLEDYHARSLVELDYGGLVGLMGDDELYDDDSAADVAHAIASLAAGEPEAAASAYQNVVARWGTLRGVEAAN